MKITVVGLGAVNGDVSLRGAEAVRAADVVLVKTLQAAPSAFVAECGRSFTALDELYEQAEDFDALDKRIADRVLERAKEGSVAYCVPGSGYDNSVREIARRVKIEVLPAAGCGESALTEAPGCSYCCYSAYDLPDARLFHPDKRLPLAVYDIDSKMAAGDVKLALCRAYGDETEALYISARGVKKIALFELDRQKGYGWGCRVLVPPQELLTQKSFDYYDLVDVMLRLRGEGGCPWDRAQTHESIKSNLVEEAYELVEAIELSDAEKMREETGDVLLQTVFHAEIAEEADEFTFTDMLNELCGKLIFRHSHIFGKDKADSADSALDTWENNKRIEKKQDTVYDAMAAVPKQFPALMRAYKLVKKARKAGGSGFFDENSADLTERLLALVERFAEAGVEPELALKDASDAFVERFKP